MEGLTWSLDLLTSSFPFFFFLLMSFFYNSFPDIKFFVWTAGPGYLPFIFDRGFKVDLYRGYWCWNYLWMHILTAESALLLPSISLWVCIQQKMILLYVDKYFIIFKSFIIMVFIFFEYYEYWYRVWLSEFFFSFAVMILKDTSMTTTSAMDIEILFGSSLITFVLLCMEENPSLILSFNESV